ncbi:S-adenosyl methyltransferase [Actinopolyspora xinjiangensis]|uniref:S-adenosyl methyltransferase n=1 Tax=Actinopolyspora xinjiangensis TaxID=405564 RepID=A0A1H0TMU6_9ACTN|nr:S-adenosyl methyltransferase [Actinopolyspora xinjiangensis]
MIWEESRYRRQMDLTRPCGARITDAFLGGCHNFGVEREFVERAERAVPGITTTVRESRAFLRRTVDHSLRSGIRQFIDLGSGLPTVGHIHEIAGRITSDHRVVYVDNEPLTAAHGSRLLADHPQAALLHEDCREIDSILSAPELRRLIDLDEPVALILTGVVHSLPESSDPRSLVRAYRDSLAVGSHLVLAHFTDSFCPERTRALQRLYAESSDPMFARSTGWIDSLFGDFEILDPGARPLTEWRPDPRGTAEAERCQVLYGGIGRKRSGSELNPPAVSSVGAPRGGAAPDDPQREGGEQGDESRGGPRLGQPRASGQYAE